MASPNNEKRSVYEHLAKLVTYHPLTGLIYWKEKPKSIRRPWHPLKPAGCIDGGGYLQISTTIGGKEYKLKQHNLAWFVTYGNLAKKGFSIDHKNDIKTDNRLKNLRLLSHSGQNIARQRGSNLPPYVCLHRPGGKFQARISVLGKQKSLGRFDDPWEAHTVVADFAIKNGLMSADEYALLITEWKEFRGGKNG